MRSNKKNYKNIRLSSIKFVFIIIIFSLVIRLFYIQIYNHSMYSQLLISQNTREFHVSTRRGNIFDKNLNLLVNIKRIPIIITTNKYINNNKEFLEYVSDNTSLKKGELYDLLSINKDILEIPLKLNYEKIINNKFNYILSEKVIRYNPNGVLSHVIGYNNVSLNKGVYGIEKAYDDILNKQVETSHKIEIANDGGFILDSYKNVDGQNFNIANSVKLTIDLDIQMIVEDVFDKYNKNGAAIISDPSNGNILSMVSRPNFIPDEIASFLKKDDMSLMNKTVQATYPPASLFKIIILLSVLESEPYLTDELFNCEGFYEIHNHTFNCSKKDGHGVLSIKDAFGQSCNSIFIQLGEIIGGEKILSMANRLGFNNVVGIGLMEEVYGHIPEVSEFNGANIGNIALGQGNVEVTPLQVNNMMSIIANNGLLKKMKIVEGIASEDGRIVKEYLKSDNIRILEPRIALMAKSYLEEVLISGTGKKLDSGTESGGGKTGTAQVFYNKKTTTHGWFSGYFPKENPNFVITILLEDEEKGSAATIPILQEILNKIYNRTGTFTDN